jgi:hypothetical protein
VQTNCSYHGIALRRTLLKKWWKQGALSASEKCNRASLKKSSLESKVLICVICKQPCHNRRNCQTNRNSQVDRASEAMFGTSDQVLRHFDLRNEQMDIFCTHCVSAKISDIDNKKIQMAVTDFVSILIGSVPLYRSYQFKIESRHRFGHAGMHISKRVMAVRVRARMS